YRNQFKIVLAIIVSYLPPRLCIIRIYRLIVYLNLLATIAYVYTNNKIIYKNDCDKYCIRIIGLMYFEGYLNRKNVC
ncbi:hypothetical protein ACJX0J_040889, partial [Zea mays]